MSVCHCHHDNRLRYHDHHDIFTGARYGQKIGRGRKWLHSDAPPDSGSGVRTYAPLLDSLGSATAAREGGGNLNFLVVPFVVFYGHSCKTRRTASQFLSVEYINIIQWRRQHFFSGGARSLSPFLPFLVPFPSSPLSLPPSPPPPFPPLTGR